MKNITPQSHSSITPATLPTMARIQHIIINPVDINTILGQWKHSADALTLLLFFQTSQPGHQIHITDIANTYHMTPTAVQHGIDELTTGGYIALGGVA